jgi:hypothetical protein
VAQNNRIFKQEKFDFTSLSVGDSLDITYQYFPVVQGADNTQSDVINSKNPIQHIPQQHHALRAIETRKHKSSGRVAGGQANKRI